MADEEEDGVGRRLLEDLQERVGGGGGELVGGVDDRDAPAAVGGGELEEGFERADLVDGDGGAQALALVVPGAPAEEELRRAEGRELAEDRVIGVHGEGRGSAAGDEVAGDAPGQRRLADAARAGHEPGMVQAAGGRGVEKARLGGGLAEESSRFRADGARPGGGRAPGSRRSRVHLGDDAGGDLGGGAGGGDDAAAGGKLGGEREEAVAEAGLEVRAEPLEAVLGAAAGAGRVRGRVAGARSRISVRSGSTPMTRSWSASTVARRLARAAPW